MYSFEFGDARVIPYLVLIKKLGILPCKADRLVDEANKYLEESDYLYDTMFVVKQMAPTATRNLLLGLDDDHELLLLTESGVRKFIFAFENILTAELFAVPRMRVIK